MGECSELTSGGGHTQWNLWVGFRRELQYLLQTYTEAPTQAKLEQLVAELQLFLKRHQEGHMGPAVLRPKYVEDYSDVSRFE